MSNKKLPHVIKASAAIQISNTVTLLERRAWNVLLHNSYKDLLEKEEHQIRIDELCEALSYNSNNQEYIKNMLRNLRKHEVQWNILDKDKSVEWGVSGLIAGAYIVNGVCYYSFFKGLREKLFNPSMYARINLITQNKFKSKYSLALYEICVDYFDTSRGRGETPWVTVEQFRELMGLGKDEYKEYKHLAQKVIKSPIKEINKISNLYVTLKTESRGPGRKITHLKFNVEQNKSNIDIPVPKIASKPNQVLLPDPLIELENIALYGRMTDDFEISPKKAHEIMSNVDELIIEKSLEYVAQKIKEDKVTSSIAGYTISVIERGGQQLVEKDNVTEKRRKLKLEDEHKQKNKQKKQKLEEDRKSDLFKQRATKVEDFFQTFTKSEQKKIIQKFEQTLSPVVLAQFKISSDLNHPMFQGLFTLYMEKNYETMK